MSDIPYTDFKHLQEHVAYALRYIDAARNSDNMDSIFKLLRVAEHELSLANQELRDRNDA